MVATNAKDTVQSSVKPKSYSSYDTETDSGYEEARDDLRDMANKAGRTIRTAFSTGKREIHDVADNVTSTIRSRPVQSCVIALGAGFVLASLLRR